MVIPKGWTKRNLKEIVLMKSGEGITAESISELGDYPCFGGNGLRGYAKDYTHNGDFALIGRQGALCGNVNFASGKFFASEHAVVVTPLKGTDIKFIYYVLKDMRLNQYAESSAQPGLAVNHLLGLSAAIPDDENEQTAIATALSDTDALIDSLEKLIAKKQAIKQGAMQELLTGKRRLKGFSGEWTQKKVKEIAPLQRGFDLPLSTLQQGHVPVVFSNGINAYHYKSMVKGPGVITGRSGTIGKLHYIAQDYWPHNTTLWVTNFCDNNPLFIFYLFHLVDWKNYMSGSGVPTLNRNDVHEKIMFIPIDVREQQAIAQILTDMDDEISALQKKLDKVRRIKQGMMAELLTGRIRLN